MTKIVLAKQPCPSPACSSSDAYHEYEDGHGYCFSCNTFFPAKRDISLLSEEFTYEYLPLREITKSTLKFYNCQTKIDKDGKPIEIGFPYSNGSVKIRSLDRKNFYSKGEINKAGLFGRDKFSNGSHKYVTITEGELDALSLYQVLKTPVVSVQSASSALRDCSLERSWLNSFERVYLAFDNDEPGQHAALSVAKLFDYNKVYVLKFDKRKDANEYLQNGEAEELRNIWWNAKRILPDTIISSFSDFRKILGEEIRKGISYPFSTLTDMTYGIRTGETVLITAQEGVGKTEIMHAIEYKLLQETDDAVAAIFLEEPKRRHLQALAGLYLQRPVHLPDCDCTGDEIVSAVEKVIRNDDRFNLYSHFGSNDPEHLLDTIRFLVSARACRYVLLDHITMAVSGLAGEDERRALDYLSTRLEMMVKELDFALILVSHVNDNGQTRGSRNISKVADIRIDATRDVENPDPIIRNTTKLSISKNRFCGLTGPAGTIVFDPKTYSYQEGFDYGSANDNYSGTTAVAA